MIGSIIGDIIGSRFEGVVDGPVEFDLFAWECEFTDDTVCVVAHADALLTNSPFQAVMRQWILQNPTKEYGEKFKFWALQENSPSYGSYGNGGCARVSPVALYYANVCEGLSYAERNVALSHSHPQSMQAASILLDAIYLALAGHSHTYVRNIVEAKIGLAGCHSVSTCRQRAKFSTDAAESIGPALTAALEANSFEQAMRNAVLIGGDTDTIACMAGGLAEALYGVPEQIVKAALRYLPDDMVAVMERLYQHAGYQQIGVPCHTSTIDGNEGFPVDVMRRIHIAYDTDNGS